MLRWGMPETVKTDNGSDYVSHYTTAVFRSLGVHQELCAPFSPWEKPHIERAFRTFCHGLVELMPGFVGHNVSERKAIEARRTLADRLTKRGSEPVEIAMEPDELQEVCDAWCESVYAHEVHGSLGKSPFQMEAAWTEPVQRITNERALDVLLQVLVSNRGRRTVQKKGLRIDGAYYVAPELAPIVGNEVVVRYDESDLGRMFVFDGEQQFICIAEDPARTGIQMSEVTAAAKARVAAARREADAFVEAVPSAKPTWRTSPARSWTTRSAATAACA